MDPYLEEEIAKAGINIWRVDVGDKLMQTVPGIALLLTNRMVDKPFPPGASALTIKNSKGEKLRVYVVSEKPLILFGLREDYNALGKTEICDKVDNDQ